MPPQAVSFVVVDTDSFTTQVMQAKPGGAVGPFTAQTTPIVEIGADYSSYAIIANTGPDEMVLVGAPNAAHGYWVVPPPQRIAAGGRTTIWLQDYPGPVGTEGSVTYRSASRGKKTFTFGCPTPWFNTCSGGRSFRTKSAGGIWGSPGSVAKTGHPFYVEFQA